MMRCLDKQTILHSNSYGLFVTWLIMLWFQNSWALDNLALLAGTLRTHQRNVCNQQTVVLNCPAGTCISVQMAQYLRSSPTICPDTVSELHADTNLTCLWPPGLQSVVEKCQKKRQCKIYSSPKVFTVEPCPGNAKYIEITYKCRPYEFRSKLTCQDDTLHMRCNPNSRVAVYSASFGRTEYETVRCLQPQGVIEETCLVSYATETVMKICHGKRQCNLLADVSTFGNPCTKQSRMYLKVIYTCVPRRVLEEKYVSRLLDDETDTDSIDDVDDYAVRADVFREEELYSESPNLAVAGRRLNVSGGVSPTTPQWLDKDDKTDTDTVEMMYVLLCTSSCILLLLLCVAKVLYQWRCHPTVADSTIQKIFTEELNLISPVVTDMDNPVTTIVTTSFTIVSSPTEPRRTEVATPAPINITPDINRRFYYGWQLPSEEPQGIIQREDISQGLPEARTYSIKSE